MKTVKISHDKKEWKGKSFHRVSDEFRMELVSMRRLSKLTLMLSSIAVCLFLTGCFAQTNGDAPESAGVVESPPVTGFSTIGRGDEDFAQRQRMTIYLDPWIFGNT